MRFLKSLVLSCTVGLVAACGGGGGGAGTPIAGPGSGAATQVAGTLTVEVLNGSGAATNAITASEVAQLRATVRNAAGAPVAGSIVRFSEAGGSLLTISPAAATALTDASGRAVVEARATSTSATGATAVQGSVSLTPANGTTAQTITGTANLAITSAPPAAQIDPQTLATALNFLDVVPADRSIVIAGSGGNGRSESAALRFRVVDAANTPVKGVSVVFSAVRSSDVSTGSGDVALNIVKATSDSDGVVVTSVSSKSVATTVVIRAQVEGRAITSQSDQLTVTTGQATQRGFDLAATKFNLNSEITGDRSDLTVRIVDSNGNPVADGVPVVFTTDYGAVGTSSRGGCVTSGGGCTVPYIVQEPRPADGTPATVAASTRLGDGTQISGSLQLAVTAPSRLDLYNARTGGQIVNGFSLGGVCKQTLGIVYVGTPAGFAAPANTTVEVKSLNSDATVTVVSGTPVLDARPIGLRTPLVLSVDATNAKGTAADCSAVRVPIEITFKSDTIAKTVIKTIQ
ncbi:hypothetical protein [uncultured Xylophilus sp.]|uniref:hypothetical protein n=1 Tax=uncultured Xylophilus sp. TaxID=296832 RepID=UPI00260061E6|nr:hypothetical protein [uncultured Xylophilus sp.]